MKGDILSLIKLAAAFIPFVLFAWLNGKANLKKAVRHRQYPMVLMALVYSGVLLAFLDKLSAKVTELFLGLAGLFTNIGLAAVGDFISGLYNTWGIYLSPVLFNTAAILAYVILKKLLLAIFGKLKVRQGTFIGSLVEIFYAYDEPNGAWHIKEHYGQARTFVKTAYYGGCLLSAAVLAISYKLCMEKLISAPFYPIFAVIILGELAFYIDGLRADEGTHTFAAQKDKAKHVAMYPLLRKPLKALFGDKLAAEGTTVNNGGAAGGAIEDILADLEKSGHIGANYAAFIRKKAEYGLKPNADYLRCGYDLCVGKSLLFNTPFYDKLDPYVFYAINRQLLTGGKVLVVPGRHGTEEELLGWVKNGMEKFGGVADMWNVSVLDRRKKNEDDLLDIGIISRSGVHDFDIHKANLPFLKKVSFVFIVEPSRLVATAQIGLNLLIKCCGKDRPITYCSVDRNCDGLVDALSHILMANITEVSATEYPPGMSSYMYWTADGDYLQHRILPGVSRCLGMGTELSMVALKNQVEKAVWYGGEAFPVLDAHWIAKQYYYDLLTYARLPANQESFDKHFQTSFNMCGQTPGDYSFVTVEDDRNNLFEMRRNFATIAQKQGFVNVISTDYMLREYMAANAGLFTADAKAIPYITADYTRSKRNVILSLCLLMCVDSVKEEVLLRQAEILNMDQKDPVGEMWRELCAIFGKTQAADGSGNPVIYAQKKNGETVCFKQHETIRFRREYSTESGKVESVYKIEDGDFARIILEDLQNAGYIPEQDDEDVYIGTELKGHVYQKYLPGQFFTLGGKYYQMVATTADNRILVRRAADHIDGRFAYRQLREYTFHNIEDSPSMGALKSINDIGLRYRFADFCVETPGYWKLRAHNDFAGGDLVKLNGVPRREYRRKQVLELDFSAFGEAFTDSVRITLTNLINEVFVTLFADNRAFISAITQGSHTAPLTYSLDMDEGVQAPRKCIYIVEDSQLDIGLLVAVERNVGRIFSIIADYLNWNEEQIEKSVKEEREKAQAAKAAPAKEEDGGEAEAPVKKKNIFQRMGDWIKSLFKKKKPKAAPDGEKDGEEKGTPKGEETAETAKTEAPPKKRNIFQRMGDWIKSLFKKKEPVTTPAQAKDGEESGTAEGSQAEGAETKTTAEPAENGENGESGENDTPPETEQTAREAADPESENEVTTDDE